MLLPCRKVIPILPLLPSLLLLLVSSQVQSSPCIKGGGWSIHFETNYKVNSDANQAKDIQCSFDTLLDAFSTQIFHYNSTSTLFVDEECDVLDEEEEFLAQLGVETREEGVEKVHEMCSQVHANTRRVPFEDINYVEGPQFIQLYYSGHSKWNEQTQTLLYPSDGETPINKLKKDSKLVPVYYEYSKAAQFQMPHGLEQFDPTVCQSHAAQCCWPRDRQAGDNNGNCNTPYDEACIDKDVADNTNLCAVELEHAPYANGVVDADGFSLFPGDNNVGEGPIHCHGYAWSTDEEEVSARFMANNLFYISMYDHMYTRGYVENIPGAPMCGCVEHMPIVTRADCTQTNVKEDYTFTKDANEDTFHGVITSVALTYQACQGANNNDNDLSAFVQQLVNDGKLTTDEQDIFKTRVVGNGQCASATDDLLEEHNFEKGYDIDPTKWTFVVGEQFDEYDEDSILDARVFKDMFASQELPIVRRVCPSCTRVSHKDIYYRRLTPMPDDFDLLDNLMNNWFDYGNEFNVDFALYSTYMDAYYDANRWEFCNFNAQGTGFPRQCGPFEKTTNQANSYYKSGGNANHHAFLLPTNSSYVSSVVNVALGKPTLQSSVFHGGRPHLAVDGNTVGIYGYGSTTHTKSEVSPWWQVNLEYDTLINTVYIWNRIDDCCRNRLSNVTVEVVDQSNTVVATKFIEGQAKVMNAVNFDGVTGSVVRISLPSTENKILSLAEVQVDGIVGDPVPKNVRAEYFEAIDWNYLPSAGLSSGRTPYKTEYVDSIYFPRISSSSDDFAGSERSEDVAALFSGYLDFGAGGNTEICLTSARNSKMFIGEELFIQVTARAKTSCNTTSAIFVHKVTVEYFNKKEDPELILEWKPVGSSALDIIPVAAWVEPPPPTTYPSYAPSSSAAPSALKNILYPVADTFVRSGSFTTSNYGSEDYFEMSNNDPSDDFNRIGLLRFDTSTTKATDCRAFLNFRINDVNTALASRSATIQRLAPNDWEEDSISYDIFSPVVDKDGPSFDVHKNDVGNWFRIEISDLMQPDELLLMIKVATEITDNSFQVNSHESEFAPFIEVYPITDAPSPVPSISSAPSAVKTILYPVADTFIRSGPHKNTNYGDEEYMTISNNPPSSDSDRIALLRFDTSTTKATNCKAFLNFRIDNVNMALASRPAIVQRLAPNDWEEDSVTYNTFSPVVDKDGPSFDVHKNDKGSWFRIEISDLMRPDDELLLMLDVTTDVGNNMFQINSHESEFAPFIEVYPITDAPSPVPSISLAPSSEEAMLYPVADTFVRSGSYKNTNFGGEDYMTISNNPPSGDSDRIALLRFDTSTTKATNCKAFLNFHIDDVNTALASRPAIVQRLAPNDWEEDSVTYNTFSPVVDKDGPSFDVHKNDKGSWFRIEISDLMQPDELLLMLDVTTDAANNMFQINSHESEFAPFIEVYPITDADV